MNRKQWGFGCITVLTVICLIAGIALVGFLYYYIPSVGEQVDLKRTISVIITDPPTDSYYPADAAIPIKVVVQSENPIATLEYWVDGTLFLSAQPEAGADPRYFSSTYQWMPVVTGDHAIVVRARDMTGALTTSNILHIVAEESAGFSILETTEDGDTWEGLAANCDSSVESVKQINPDLDPNQPLPPGERIRIPCDPLVDSVEPSNESSAPLATDGIPPAPEGQPGDIGVWVDGNVLSNAGLPQAPSVTAGLNSCQVALVIQDNSQNEKGFFVYRSGESGFERIYTVNANTQPTFAIGDPVDKSGLLQYYVSAFNSSGEAESNIVPVKIAEGVCGPAPDPNLEYVDGILSMSADYKLAYLYASLDQGPWQRLPEGEEFFTLSGGSTDIQPYLSQVLSAKPNARAADLEVWGWTNGGALIELGRLHLIFENTKLEFCDLVGEPCSGDVGSSFWTTKDGVVAADEIYDHSRTFRFNANTAGASHILVQISTRPFPDGFQVNSPYLVDAYAVPAGQGQDSIFGQFSIDFSTLNKPGQVKQSSAVHNPPGTIFNFSPQVRLSPFLIDIIKNMKENGAGADQQLGLSEPAYYIRIVPWDLTKPTGKPSNTITITYKYMGPPPPLEIMSEQPPLYDIKIAEFHPERQIDPENFGCVAIRGVSDPMKLMNWWEQQPNAEDESPGQIVRWWKSFSGETMCPSLITPPQEEESSWWDDLMGFVSDVFSPVTSLWNGVVDLWNGAKNMIVDAVASIINTIVPGLCEDDKNIEGVSCKDLLMEGLNAAITACTGLPPTLPSAPDLTSITMDYAVNYGISMAAQEYGIDCDTECVADIRSTLSTLADQANSNKPQPGCYSSEASEYGYNALCIPPGVDFDYVPGSFHETAVVVVQVTRNNNAVSPGLKQYNYRLFITSIVKNDAVAGTTYSCPVAMVTKDLSAPDPAEGILYQPKIMPLPPNAVQGTQFTVPVPLDNVADVQGTYSYMYPPFQQLVDQGALDLETAKYCSARLLGSRGYTITIKAQLTCIDPETETAVQCPASDGIQDTQQYTPER